MELRHKNFKAALELMRRATAEPSVEVKRRVATDGNKPVQTKLYKSLRLWMLYVDLEESLGTLESTCAVYKRILDLGIATPQVILNYALLLEENKYFEDAFKVYEKGVKILKNPHDKEIRVAYLKKFVERYGGKKLERARELFENAVEKAPAECAKSLYLQYAKLEENYGSVKRAMEVYDRASKAVPPNQKLDMYKIYISWAKEIFGFPRTREIYEQAIQFGLPVKDVKTLCLEFAKLEKSLGEIDRARAIYRYASTLADPRIDPNFWSDWHEFEVQHGNEETFREMLRIKRSIAASFSQFILPEYLMQKDEFLNPGKTVDALRQAGLGEDQMAALEKKLTSSVAGPFSNSGDDNNRIVGFVSAGLVGTADGCSEKTSITTHEDIELHEESDSEDEKDTIEVTQKNVPSAVFGGLAKKRKVPEGCAVGESSDVRLGALKRMNRRKSEQTAVV